MNSIRAGAGLPITKKCKRKQCNNMIPNTNIHKYCSDPRCLAERDIKSIKKEKAKLFRKNLNIYSPNINLILPKRDHLIGKTIVIRCCANGINGRCYNKFSIAYSYNRKYYPKYCEIHRNEWKRELFINKYRKELTPAPSFKKLNLTLQEINL